MLNKSEEVWLKIWASEVYEASNKGRIRNSETGKILKQRKKKTGYMYVKLCPVNRDKREYLVHRLVAQAFKKGYSRHKVVRHLNNRRTDNYPENLVWSTQSINIKHSWQTTRNKQYLNY